MRRFRLLCGWCLVPLLRVKAVSGPIVHAALSRPCQPGAVNPYQWCGPHPCFAKPFTQGTTSVTHVEYCFLGHRELDSLGIRMALKRNFHSCIDCKSSISLFRYLTIWLWLLLVQCFLHSKTFFLRIWVTWFFREVGLGVRYAAAWHGSCHLYLGHKLFSWKA